MESTGFRSTDYSYSLDNKCKDMPAWLMSRGSAGAAANRVPRKKREVVELVFPVPTSACLPPPPPFLWMIVFSFFFFFNRSVLESGTRAYPTNPPICPFYYGGALVRAYSGAYSLLRSRSRRAIERVG